MPCNDITETVRLVLDLDDNVLDYSLIKRSCGKAVGERSLILSWIRGRRADDLLNDDVEAFLEAYPNEDETLEFLYLKHFFAVRAGLAVLTGRECGSIGSECVAQSITCDTEGTEFIGQLKIAVLTEKIKSCGGCGSCGSKKKARKAEPAMAGAAAG
ncbi:MAG: hypothetical protein RLY93_15040 [Sumerlaeia bacterium]